MKIIKHVLLIFALVLVLLVTAILGTVTVMCKGPSKAATTRFVNTLMETSALKFVPKIYFSQEEIDAMLAAGEVRTPSVQTDLSLLEFGNETSNVNEGNNSDISNVQTQTGENPGSNAAEASENAASASEEEPEEDLVIEEIRTETYRGRMMIVKDPSRVYIRMIPSFSETGSGQKVIDMANADGATAGMNAGGFYDPEGHGRGGMPLGAVIKDGVLVCNFPSDFNTIIGFDARHRLIVGDMSPEAAIAAGMMDGIAFGPALVINGERVPTGSAGGVNPRSAIGQRSDGAVLLLSIDGRQPTSLGATASELEDIMLEYGAVNAANLDGGSSSVLYYKGELISSPSSVVGIRPVPTAILVK